MTRLMVTAAVALAIGAGAVPAGAVAGHAVGPRKVLVVTHTTGFRHTEGIEAGEKAMREIGERSGAFSVDYCRTADDVKAMLTPSGLDPYAAVVFLNTTGDLGIPDLPAFLDWIKSGKGFLGMHSATDTYHDQSTYIDMIGGEFETHGQQAEVEPIVNDKRHPATRRWPAGFRILDEIYHHRHFDRARVHVLLSLSSVPDDRSATANQPADFPLAWCKPYGKGRVFYTAFGHRGDVWTNEVYRQHVLGAVRWALGLDRASVKLGNPAPAAR
ncbi:MAG: ThuA domain-containing protein [Chthonomonadales bacterium]|nr:ThuA domain-containing protein [Chthonomonadales bacterium]